MKSVDPEESVMTADQAVREVLQIERRTGLLVQRTIGITWMLWAVVNAGIFVSYEAITLAGPSGTFAWVGYGLAWAPWVGLGVIATTVLWRSLAIAVPPNVGDTPGVAAVATATFLILVLGGLAVLAVVHVPVIASSWAMFAVGIAAAVVGGSGLTTQVRSERSLWVIGGVVLAVLAVGVNLIAGRIGYDPHGLVRVLAPMATTALLFGGGLYTANR
jgi:hypothetical protein